MSLRRLAVVAALVLAVLGGALLFTRGADDDTEGVESRAPQGKCSAKEPRATSIQVDKSLYDVAVGHGRVWVSDPQKGRVSTLDVRTGRVIGKPIEIGRQPLDLAADPHGVWVVHEVGNALTRLDPRTRKPDRQIRFPDPPFALEESAGGVWIALLGKRSSRSLRRVAGSRPRVSRFDVRGVRDISNFAARKNAIWVLDDLARVLVRVDPETGRAARRRARLPTEAFALEPAAGTVWVTHTGTGDSAIPVDTRTMRAGTPVDVGADPQDMVIGHGCLWVVNTLQNSVTRIDPVTRRKVGEDVQVALEPTAAAVSRDSIWVTSYRTGAMTRIRPR